MEKKKEGDKEAEEVNSISFQHNKRKMSDKRLHFMK